MKDPPPILPPSIISMAFASSLFLLVLLGVALGDEKAAGTGTTSDGTIAPRGQRMARDIKYGDWRKVCFKPGGASMVCRTSISGTWDTGQVAVRADLIEREGESAARLQLFLPVGLYLPAGVKVAIDQGAAHQIPYVWCLTNTCIAAEVADPKMIEEMAAGQTLAVEVVDSNVLTVTTTLPLAQFASVRRNPPAQTFEQDIDE
ncbi:MAG TPA: invasion associated locus B family protein [Bradyrhizobium sp.]|nr:invasion associated locus B family protein [Bradyrhizobium sp.]